MAPGDEWLGNQTCFLFSTGGFEETPASGNSSHHHNIEAWLVRLIFEILEHHLKGWLSPSLGFFGFSRNKQCVIWIQWESLLKAVADTWNVSLVLSDFNRISSGLKIWVRPRGCWQTQRSDKKNSELI